MFADEHDVLHHAIDVDAGAMSRQNLHGIFALWSDVRIGTHKLTSKMVLMYMHIHVPIEMRIRRTRDIDENYTIITARDIIDTVAPSSHLKHWHEAQDLSL